MHSKRVDLRALAGQIGDGKLSFASPERMMTHLGVTPGSVSPFGLINDRNHHVRVVHRSRSEVGRAPLVPPEHQHRDGDDQRRRLRTIPGGACATPCEYIDV